MHECHLKILSKTCNGKIFKCTSCNNIHVEYKNLSFSFNTKEFDHFSKYMLALNAEHWEKINKDNFFTRKIIIPIGHHSFKALFNVEEVYELQSMLNKVNANKKEGYPLIGIKRIDVQLSMN